MNKLSLFIITAFLMVSFSGLKNAYSKKDLKGIKPAGEPGYTLLNINNISTWVYADGRGGNTPNSDPGTFFPRLTGNVVYIDGMVWGGLVKDGQTPELRVGGSTYLSGLQPGRILGIRTGNAENPNAGDARIWRVRTDWETADLYDEVRERGWQFSEQQIRDQYQTDWNEWPAVKGAPYQDVNGNGRYDSDSDIPGIPGADQTIWYVANDLDAANTMNLAGSQPIGIEMQVTFWAYLRPEGDPFGDIVFRHTRMIYKGTAITSSQATIDDMYLTIWSDPDIGEYINDFVGCDSLLNLAYGYNGYAQDYKFQIYDLYPPAFGYLFMHGPIIPSPGDTAVYDFSKRPGFNNLDVSSFLYFASGSADSDPTLGDYAGTLEWYNLMQGLRPQAGTPWINPLTNQATKFPLCGDPIKAEGWIDGITYQASDRRMGLTTGPFTIVLGDTQEVMCAMIGDISSSVGTAYIKNISGVRQKAKNVKNLIKNGVALNIQGNSLSRLNSTVDLTLYYLVFNEVESVISSSWTLTDKPASSNSMLSQSGGSTTSFIPDMAGSYVITATINTATGAVHSAEFIVEATDNKDAIAHISLDQTDISWGDSVLADGSASYDPDGDELDFSWYVGGAGVSSVEDGKKAYIYPRATGDHEVTLTLFDGYFESSSVKNFMVHPRLHSMSVQYSFIDTNWIRNVLYFHGDTILVPIWHLDSLFIYDISDEKIERTKSIYLPDKLQVFKLDDNLLYIGSDGESGFFGPGRLSIYEVGEDWALTPVLEDYVPDLYEISVMQFYENYILVRDVFRNLYRIDFETNPSNPTVLNSADFSQTGIYGLQKFDDYFIMGIGGNYPDKYLIRIDETTLSIVDTLNFPLNWNSFSINDNLLFLTFRDSSVIYNISDLHAPERLGKITTISPVSWLIPGEYGSYYHISSNYAGNNLLAVHTTAGFQIYDINNPENPSFVASYYSGMRGQGGGPILRYQNGTYYATGMWDQVVYDNDIYSGINRIDLDIPQQTKNAGVSRLPENYELKQNYPNPFNPSTIIEYYLPHKTDISIDIYNIIGQKVVNILDKKQNSGKYEVKWNGVDEYGHPVASGVYFYRLKTSDREMTRKMLLLR